MATDADGTPAVVLRELARAYGDRVALAGVTLELPRGATLAVFGANGAGKTTLLRVLATLLRPHRGAAPVAIARNVGEFVMAATWGRDGTIVFDGTRLLMRVAAPR